MTEGGATELDLRRDDRDRLQRVLAGRYTLVRLLGRGGMGAVYLARDVALQRLVAIKMLLPELQDDAERRERFREEALTNARLAHPNIVPVYSFEAAGEVTYLVMRYIAGHSLAFKLWRSEPMPVREVCRILADVASALDYAHRQRVVHRDIKPENVLIDKETGVAMLTDFGVARGASLDAMSIGEAQAEQGMVRGTPHYMSPEQAAGEWRVDGRSDLYSLGVLGYEMLTGQHPFEGARTMEMPAKHMTARPSGVHVLAPDTPEGLAEIISRCLEKSPDDRWSDGRQLREALIQEGVTKRVDRLKTPRATRWLNALVKRVTGP